ncbi:MAG TPA: ROK family protein [Acidimicrobiia bacterium]|nr:ROK family protein [Acidimicrobiia bacterium]
MARIRIGIDVGGSGVKGGLVDTDSGKVVSVRVRFDTPRPATPAAIASAVESVVESLGGEGPIGIGFPAVVKDGLICSAANIDPLCIGVDAVDLFSGVTGREVTVINDADAAGLGESRFGEAKGFAGTVIMLTFGTGIGSALLSDGKLVPNVELGQIELRGVKPAEVYFSAKARTDDGLEWSEWGARANEFVSHVNKVFSPNLIVVGGGVITKWKAFADSFDPLLPVVPAGLGKNAGIIGAASLVAGLPSGLSPK